VVREPAVRLPRHDAEFGQVDDSQAHGEVDLAGEPDGITADWRACSMIGRKGIQPAWLTIRPTNPTSMPVQATESLDEDLDRDHAICHSLARHYSTLNH